MHTPLSIPSFGAPCGVAAVLLLCAAFSAIAEGPPKDVRPMNATPLDSAYLRRHAETRGFMLGRPVRPRVTPDGKFVLFLRAQPRKPQMRLYEFEVATGKTRELLTPEMVLKGAAEHLSAEEKARRERQRVSVGGFTTFHLSHDGDKVLVSLSGRLYVVRRDGSDLRELKTSAGTLLDPQFSPDGKKVAYLIDHDVFVYDLEPNKETRVTTGGTPEQTHGLAEFVAQEEMQRFSGYWWGPEGKQIAYEESNTNGVETWYVADPIHPERAPQPSAYPRPGKANAKVRLGLIGSGGGETTWVQWDAEKHPYLASVRWPRKGPLTILVQDRLQQEQVLLKVDPQTGKTTPLLTERDPAWVNINHEVPRWLPDGSFLWSGEGPQGPQLEWREACGELRRVVVPVSEGYGELVNVDGRNRRIVYSASTDPTQHHLFQMALDGGKPEQLTKQPGTYSAVFARNHQVYALTSSQPRAMPRTTVHRADGTLVGELPSVAEEPPFTPCDELLEVGEGRTFHAAVIRPHDFDARKRYPVILHVYGGPTHLQVTASMGTRLIDQWLADQGFIVASLDNRGTPGRGRDWEKAVYGKFGSVPLDDQVAGLRALGKRFSEMDIDRVGIYGWSFGGYLSALAALRRPDVVKAAVAGAPVVDWLDYDTHYTERYLGLPDKDGGAYKEGSLLTYVDGLRRPLLLVHGTADDNVFFRHTLKLCDALFRAGKDFEVLPLSGLTHMVPDPVVTERLYGRFAAFFHKHLGKPNVPQTVPDARPRR
jgi:dipeptidyl-peptidase-4